MHSTFLLEENHFVSELLTGKIIEGAQDIAAMGTCVIYVSCKFTNKLEITFFSLLLLSVEEIVFSKLILLWPFKLACKKLVLPRVKVVG